MEANGYRVPACRATCADRVVRSPRHSLANWRAGQTFAKRRRAPTHTCARRLQAPRRAAACRSHSRSRANPTVRMSTLPSPTPAKPRVMSGMRPTGQLHIGHYFAVLSQWVTYCDLADAYFEIADLH